MNQDDRRFVSSRTWFVPRLFAVFFLAVFCHRTAAMAKPVATESSVNDFVVTVRPSKPGQQIVRFSLPLSKGFLRENQALLLSDGQRETAPALRVLTWC